MDPQTAANLEVLRQRAMGGSPSGAGMPGGAETANAPTIANPIAAAGMARPNIPTQAPQGMSGSSPYASGISAIQKSNPDEATIIVKGLLSRLADLSPSQGSPNA